MWSVTPIVLASGSPRRVEMLTAAGLQFTQKVADIVEDQLPGESVIEFVMRLAREKAERVAPNCPGAAVIGADTVVAVGELVLGKPVDEADAVRMLRELRSNTHVVVSAFAVINAPGGGSALHSSSTAVTFSEITDQQIDSYVASGEPLDKAGAYAIQGMAAQFVEKIEGSYTSVVGLDLCALLKSLQALGVISPAVS